MTGTAPTWTILVPTLGERRPLFERLMGALLPQLDSFGGQVRVAAWFNNGSPSLPTIRQRMVVAADSDYISFVDDDDLVAPYFVEAAVEALSQRPDYVGWQVQCYSDGVPIAVSYHALEHGRWANRGSRFLRDISHINPIRTKIAQAVDFRKARKGQPEDRAWAEQLRRSRLLRTEVVVDRIMYHYLYSTSGSAGQGSRWKRPDLIQAGERAVIESPHFSWSHT